MAFGRSIVHVRRIRVADTDMSLRATWPAGSAGSLPPSWQRPGLWKRDAIMKYAHEDGLMASPIGSAAVIGRYEVRNVIVEPR